MSSVKFIKNLVNDSYSSLWIVNTFIAFKSINDIFLLIFTNKNNSILSYDIIDNIKINEIKGAHKKYITNFRYYFDKDNNRDLFLSISSDDNNIKLWNNYNFECLLDIKNINQQGYLDSACFLKDNNNICIITSNFGYSDLIKVFDFKGKKIKEIINSNEEIIFINSYYDKKLNKNFIVACSQNYSISYDYNKNEIYQKYLDNNRPRNFVINNKEEEVVELIESSTDGNIRIWNFHSGKLLKKIKVSNNILRDICLWDKDYLFVGCDDSTIKLVEYNSGKMIKELEGHKDKVITLKMIVHPQFGKCLLSQEPYVNSIKLWN